MNREGIGNKDPNFEFAVLYDTIPPGNPLDEHLLFYEALQELGYPVQIEDQPPIEIPGGQTIEPYKQVLVDCDATRTKIALIDTLSRRNPLRTRLTLQLQSLLQDTDPLFVKETFKNLAREVLQTRPDLKPDASAI